MAEVGRELNEFDLLLPGCNRLEDAIRFVEVLLVRHQRARLDAGEHKVGQLLVPGHRSDELQLRDAAVLVGVDLAENLTQLHSGLVLRLLLLDLALQRRQHLGALHHKAVGTEVEVATLWTRVPLQLWELMAALATAVAHPRLRVVAVAQGVLVQDHRRVAICSTPWNGCREWPVRQRRGVQAASTVQACGQRHGARAQRPGAQRGQRRGSQRQSRRT
mmetsp:Transcript_60700/g.172544  ORF Transcript_60700/g.172544 Transcript_60700/m.172544 type:complete len:218 (-) Transcript_60700:117-770(-)